MGIDFDGTRLGGGRSHPMILPKVKLIYLVEEDSQN